MKPLAEFVLPFPPSVNTYWRQNYTRRCTYVGKEGKAYQSNVLASVIESLGRMPKAVTGELLLELDLYPPTKRVIDTDNRLKACLDALEMAGVYANDSQIKRLVVEMFPSVGKPGRAVVRLFDYSREAQ